MTAKDAGAAVLTASATISLDGESVEFAAGETLYQVARRCAKSVPTLCYDDRLEAFGACRLCVVEVEGQRNPVASCTTRAEAGMVVRTEKRAVVIDAVDYTNRYIAVRGTSGQTLAMKVASDVPLEQLSAGDRITVVHTAAVAVELVPQPAKPAAKKAAQKKSERHPPPTR